MKAFLVSQVNQYIKRILSTDVLLSNLSIKGEISNLKYHGSGNVFFSLKDEKSKINGFISRENLTQIGYELEDGMEITGQGSIFLYDKNGSYSFNIRTVLVEGQGNLHMAFEKLKEKLKAEGLFEPKYKKALPAFPEKIVVMTSDTGAAVQDMIKTIKARNHLVDICIVPVQVQGPGAKEKIVESIEMVNAKALGQVILLGRGGGSLEDLWAFNEEQVARAIFNSEIPIVTGIGHETDTSISDYVADVRGLTPTAAAQLATPNVKQLESNVDQYFEESRSKIQGLLEKCTYQLKTHDIRVNQGNLLHKIDRLTHQARGKINECRDHLKKNLDEKTVHLASIEGTLESLNPERLYEVGYATVMNQQDKMIQSIKQLKIDEAINIQFKDGKSICTVKELIPKKDKRN